MKIVFQFQKMLKVVNLRNNGTKEHGKNVSQNYENHFQK